MDKIIFLNLKKTSEVIKINFKKPAKCESVRAKINKNIFII